MAIYRTGQASMDAQGYITGYGTKWREQLTLIRAGATIIFLSNPLQFGVITEVINDTSMRAITTNGAVVSKVNYVIFLHDSLTVDGLAQDVAETLRYYQGKETEFAHFIEFLQGFDFKKLEDLTNQTKASAAAAKTSETNAKTSETKAKTSETNAKKSETNAKASETAANNSKNAAKTSETNAKASETAANNSKNAAATSATNAKNSENAAKAAQNNAEGAEASAMASEEAAAASAAAAKASQTAAKTSETNAKTSETNANNSKNAAKTSETNAKTSETNAKTSENKAKEYADQASKIANPLTQYDWPVITGNENVYVKIAKLTDPGSNNSHMTLMVTNGGNYGSTYGNIDFIEISARGLANITTSNVANFLSIRRLGSTSLDDTNQMRYGLVKGDGFIEVWAFQRAFINGAKVAILAQTARTELYIPTGFVKQTAMPSGYVESSPRRIYDQGNKPGKGDVGLGNVTNDAQVKKAGDTMSGDLEITKGNAALHLKATGGNSHVWFKNGDGSERGVIWSPPNSDTLGEVHIRAKTTGGTTGGDLVVRHDGRVTARDLEIAYKIKSRTLEVANTDTNTAATTLKTTGKQHTPVVLTRDADSNLSIGFKLNNMNQKLLGIDIDGDIAFGENPDQKQNSKLITKKMLDAGYSFSGGFAGAWNAEDISDQTVDLNNLVIKKKDVGSVRYYHCISQGGGSKITNKPSGVTGNFIMRLESVRKVSDTDYTCRQLLYSSDTSRQYERYCSNGTWSAWRENVVSGLNQDVNVKALSATGRLSGGELAVGGNGSLNGNLGVGGGNPARSTDKGIVIGSGSMVRESADGRLILSSSGNDPRKLSLRPAGENASNNGIEISCTSASGGDTKLAFGQGAAIRCNGAGSPIISAKEGQMIYIRPNGDSNANGQVTIAGNGKMVVNGEFESTGDLTCARVFSKGALQTESGGIELYHTTPFIDFHFNKSTSDYTARIIHDSANQLTLDCQNVRMLNNMSANGVIRGASNDAFVAWPYNDPNAAVGQIRIAPKFQSRFNNVGGPGRASFWIEEHVGTNHRAVIEVAGFGAAAQYWHFRSDGMIWNSARGDVSWAGTSDLRFKNNVVDYDGLQSLENIKAMNLIKFTYKDDDRNRERRGVAAQQVMEIDPCYVKKSEGSYIDENGDQVNVEKLVLDTNPLLMDALCAIKALSAQVDELKEEIKKLKGE